MVREITHPTGSLWVYCLKGRGMSQNQQQIYHFREAARALECDDSEARFDAKLKKVAKASKPTEPVRKRGKLMGEQIGDECRKYVHDNAGDHLDRGEEDAVNALLIGFRTHLLDIGWSDGPADFQIDVHELVRAELRRYRG
ncbi:hypothetical protein MCELHM10_01496 [Paracoccaceae bacterium]